MTLKNIQFKWKTALQVMLLLTLTVPLWTKDIARVVNVDEPRWIIRGANFYYAITHRDFENTFYEYHPGVTNMWIVATALHFYFPEYRGIGQGYFDPLKPKFEEFMREYDREALELVRYSRWLQAGILAVLVVIAFLLLRKLIDDVSALLAMALAVISPFYLGHSRLLNLEGMLALFVLIALLAALVYVYNERRLIFLLLSGVMFGLAQLSKSSSIVALGMVGLVLLVGGLREKETKFTVRFLWAGRSFFIWVFTAVVTYFLLWPGMWVAPDKMLSGVYGNAVSYAFQGARLDVTEQLQPASFETEYGLQGVFDFLKAWASSSTPITWFGLVMVFAVLIYPANGSRASLTKSVLAYLALLGMLFIIMFGIALGRDSQHYILSSYVAFDIIAGMGWGFVLDLFGKKWPNFIRLSTSYLLLMVIILAQVGFDLPFAPYYFNYKNPLASEPATYGYGEGFSEAADYLSQKPNAQESRAYVYIGMGTFSFFYPGETVVLKRVYILDGDYTAIINDLRRSDYLVMYPITREKYPEQEILLDVLKDVQPEKVITLNGVEYIYIYRVADIPEAVYEALHQK